MEESTTAKKADQIDEVNDTLEKLDMNKENEGEDKLKKDKLVKENKERETSPPVKLPNIISQCQKDEYLVKTIDWKDKKIRIITQNENGPCPLVAICNVLFLRGDLDIQPPDREIVTFEYLVDRLGDYLLTHPLVEEQEQQTTLADATAATTTTTNTAAPTATIPHKLEKRQETTEFVLTYRHNLDTALSILPNLKSGLDVNVQFESIRGFEPTAELAMFDLFNVDLVHGWIADPQDMETFDVVVKKCGTYNQLVECIVQADELSSTKELTIEDEEKLHQGFIANEFLKDTATQLTYYGLDLLLDSIPTDTLCVLFRNNHFSTVYRHASLGLYMLVTDSGLILERSIVWESLGDVDQSSSEFFNGNFKKPELQENHNIPTDITDPHRNSDLDFAIAASIQDEQKRQKRNSYLAVKNNNNIENTNNNNNKQTKNKCIIS